METAMGCRPLPYMASHTERNGDEKGVHSWRTSYLRGLWAVSNVTPTRIIYSDEFKRYFLREHGKGRGVTEIFRNAGLPVPIIGRKRIERCAARWVRPDHCRHQ